MKELNIKTKLQIIDACINILEELKGSNALASNSAFRSSYLCFFTQIKWLETFDDFDSLVFIDLLSMCD
jgi:hypothetical protein